jgi:TonB family protein
MNRPQLLIAAILLLVIGINAKTSPLGGENANSIAENDTILAVVDKEPEFPGGNAARIEFIQQNIKYPEDAQRNKLEGKVNIQFVVSSIGQIIQAKVVKKLSPSLDEEALRVINSFPRWIPGELNGKKVPVYRVMQVVFKYVPVDNAGENWQMTDSTLIVIDSIKLPLKFNLEVINSEQIDTGFILKPFPETAQNKLIEQYGKVARNGVLLLNTYDIMNLHNDTSKCKIVYNGYTYKDVSKVPQFPGGDIALMNYLAQHIKYPIIDLENGHQGKVIVQFIIDRSGKVKDPKVVTSVSPGLDREALRVLSQIPDWIPGEINGKKENIYYTLPIVFKIEGELGRHSSNVKFDSLQIVLDGQILPISFKSKWLNSSKLTSLNTIVPKNEKEKKELIEKYGTAAANGVIIAISKREDPVSKAEVRLEKDSLGNIIYDVVEKMPEYQGGDVELMNFLKKNLIYPEAEKNKNIQGNVIVFFVVNTLGKIEQAKVLKSLSPECDKEVLRVINLMTNWIPGKQNGVPVSVRYTLPIKFGDASGNIVTTSSLNATDRKAEYPGGFNALGSYLARNIKYPVRAMENDQRGQILVGFTVNELGLVDNVHILNKVNETATLLEKIVVTAIGISYSSPYSISPQVHSTKSIVNYLEKEAISVVKSIPKWIPGLKDGQSTSESFILPILFKKNFQN